MSQLLNIFLGLRDRSEKVFENAVQDISQKFKNKQGLFLGERKTYVAIDGYADEPTKRSFVPVASTVEEQYAWFKETTKDHFKTVFSIERTNAGGTVKDDLIVNGENWGSYTSMELLRLKSILDGKLKLIFSDAPIRREDTIWVPSTDDLYAGKKVFESIKEEGHEKTALKEDYILTDPHADKGGRPPQVTQKSSQVNIGAYTKQSYSGQISIRERAELIRKYEILYQAVVVALGKANNVEIEESDLGDKVLNYFF